MAKRNMESLKKVVDFRLNKEDLINITYEQLTEAMNQQIKDLDDKRTARMKTLEAELEGMARMQAEPTLKSFLPRAEIELLSYLNLGTYNSDHSHNISHEKRIEAKTGARIIQTFFSLEYTLKVIEKATNGTFVQAAVGVIVVPTKTQIRESKEIHELAIKIKELEIECEGISKVNIRRSIVNNILSSSEEGQEVLRVIADAVKSPNLKLLTDPDKK